jgi:hypothetical protein
MKRGSLVYTTKYMFTITDEKELLSCLKKYPKVGDAYFDKRGVKLNLIHHSGEKFLTFTDTKYHTDDIMTINDAEYLVLGWIKRFCVICDEINSGD